MRGVALVGLVALLAGCPRGPDRAAADEAGVAALASDLAAAALFASGGEPLRYAVSWGDGGGLPIDMVRLPGRWESIDGAPALRVAFANDVPGRRATEVVVEWLRPAGDRVLCPRRRIGETTLRLEPPVPVLVSPLEPGRSWEWAGRAGDRAATATFRVLGWREGGEQGRLLAVEQVTRTGELESVRRVLYAPGRGPVAEEGSAVVDEYGQTVDGVRARPRTGASLERAGGR